MGSCGRAENRRRQHESHESTIMQELFLEEEREIEEAQKTVYADEMEFTRAAKAKEEEIEAEAAVEATPPERSKRMAPISVVLTENTVMPVEGNSAPLDNTKAKAPSKEKREIAAEAAVEAEKTAAASEPAAPWEIVCNCTCGCKRRPGRKITCRGCIRGVGPGCCWEASKNLSHECAKQKEIDTSEVEDDEAEWASRPRCRCG